MSISKNIDTEITRKLGKLKWQIFDSYFDDLELKKSFLGEEIAYDFFLYPALFKKYKIKPRGAIYLGGHKGELLLQFALLGFADILIVEPMPNLFKKLKEKIDLINNLLNIYGDLLDEKPVSSIEAIQFAISNECTNKDFYVTSNSYIGSLLEPKTEAFEEQEIVSDATVKNRIIVPTLTVDEMIKQSSKSFSDLNFLYMNIQGAELSALEKAEETLTHLDCIYLEKNIVSRYENCPSPDEIDNFLLEHNFIKEWEYIDQRWGGGFSFYIKP